MHMLHHIQVLEDCPKGLPEHFDKHQYNINEDWKKMNRDFDH